MVTKGESGVGVHGVVFVDFEISELPGGCLNQCAPLCLCHSFSEVVSIILQPAAPTLLQVVEVRSSTQDHHEPCLGAKLR